MNQEIDSQNMQKNVLSYEIMIWLPKYEDMRKFTISIPAVINLGRKSSSVIIGHHNQTERRFDVEQKKYTENNVYYYEFTISGDSCLSRKHLAIHIPKVGESTPWIEDLGSTHGIILFTDSSREIGTSVSIKNLQHSDFRNEKEQHLQLGNTFVRIRRLF